MACHSFPIKDQIPGCCPRLFLDRRLGSLRSAGGQLALGEPRRSIGQFLAIITLWRGRISKCRKSQTRVLSMIFDNRWFTNFVANTHWCVGVPIRFGVEACRSDFRRGVGVFALNRNRKSSLFRSGRTILSWLAISIVRKVTLVFTLTTWTCEHMLTAIDVVIILASLLLVIGVGVIAGRKEVGPPRTATFWAVTRCLGGSSARPSWPPAFRASR